MVCMPHNVSNFYEGPLFVALTSLFAVAFGKKILLSNPKRDTAVTSFLNLLAFIFFFFIVQFY